MKNRRKTLAGIMALTMLMTAAFGCSESKASSENTEKSSVTDEVLPETTGSSKVKAENVSYSVPVEKLIDSSGIFSKRDLKQTADLSSAAKIEVSDGKTVDITEAGVYVISGSAKNCTIRIEASKEDKVQLVLDGVTVENEDFPAIYVVSADKCFITTADGSKNSLTVSGEFRADGDTNTDAVIFSKDDIVLNGLGTLNIASEYGNGISGKDDMKITGGTYITNTAKHSFEAKDSIAVCGGTFTITTVKDGFHCENKDDNTIGWIYISDGSFKINSGSDGVRGTTYVQIDGGDFDITSAEGIEGTYVQINGGTINISASDDGINAAAKSSFCDVVIEFNGGYTTIVMSPGDTDGVDANGNIIVNGGTIDITITLQGPASAFDYDGTAAYNGGTIIINGEQVSEIPQSMMGGPGGMRGPGGRGGRGGFGGFDGSEMPEDFGDFHGKRPGDFENMTPPEGFEDMMPPWDFEGMTPPDGDFGGKRGKRPWDDSSPTEPTTAEETGNNVII